MKSGIATMAALLLAAGCSPGPRSASYFAAHPAEADRVLAACRRGAVRGPECANAVSGPVARENAARLETYRRSFAR
jgi:hypothetical protein